MKFKAASLYLACSIAAFGLGDVRSGGGALALETGGQEVAGAVDGEGAGAGGQVVSRPYQYCSFLSLKVGIYPHLLTSFTYSISSFAGTGS